MQKKLFLFFAVTEIVLGALQCYRVLREALLPGEMTVENTILLASGILALSLGWGLLLKKSLAVKALIFFASGVAFSKLLIWAGVFTLPEISEILLPKRFENAISLVYHSTLAVSLLRTTTVR